MGDDIFDTYYSSNVPFLSSSIVQESTMQSAGSSLLRKIGSAILISHSQGGLMPWLLADSVPELVKAIISIEPKGPPFTEVIFSSEPARKWGLTDIPLYYSPLPNGTADDALKTVVVENPRIEGEGQGSCVMQKSPARQLSRWSGIPVLVETGEASYHEVYEECTVTFLRQAGVDVEWLRLKNAGIHGNAHLQFMEDNSDEIAKALDTWIKKMTGAG
jgi:pimeloyl-ACP methyl ester carboxylesterase